MTDAELAAYPVPLRAYGEHRVLVLPCSATKRRDSGPLPACHRYAGPLWQSYRAAVRFADGAELPRTLDSIRAVGAHQRSIAACACRSASAAL